MNIQSTELLRGLSAYKNNQAAQPKRAGAENQKSSHLRPDEVILSNRGSEISATMRQLRETDDLRQELVAEIKERLKTGNYYVEAEKIAEKIIEASKVGL
jgi:negative regulator of flagellin synthesis FlgM